NIHRGNADMDIPAESDPVRTAASAHLQRSVDIAVARLLGLFPRRIGSGDEDAHGTTMVPYRGTRYYERSHAAGKLRGQRVVSHSHSHGQEYGSTTGVFGSGWMRQRRN